MRSFGSAGFARTCSCSCANAATGSPLFSVCSATLTTLMALLLVTPLVGERHTALRQAVLSLRYVFDFDFVERKTHTLDDVRGATPVARLDREAGDASVLDRDLQVFELGLARLAQGQHGLLDRLVRPQRQHQRGRGTVDVLQDLELVDAGLS